MEYASTENASTSLQRWKTKVQQLKEYFEEFTIFQSCISNRSAVSRFSISSPVLYQTGVIHKKSDSCWTHAQKGPASKIAGKLFTLIVPGSLPTARFMTHVTCRLTTKNRDQLRNPTLGNRVLATFTFFTSDYLRYLR